MYNDPTEPRTSLQHQRVIPPPPPPITDSPYPPFYYSAPPKQNHKTLVVIIICLSCLVVVLAGSLFVVIYRQDQKPGTTSISISTPTIISPTAIKHYTAYQIANKIKGEINIQNLSDISNDSGNTGTVQVEVLDSNGPVELIIGTYETEEEATTAMNYYLAVSDGPTQGYHYNYCMMMYSPSMSTYVLSNIIQQVNGYCV